MVLPSTMTFRGPRLPCFGGTGSSCRSRPKVLQMLKSVTDGQRCGMPHQMETNGPKDLTYFYIFYVRSWELRWSPIFFDQWTGQANWCTQWRFGWPRFLGWSFKTATPSLQNRLFQCCPCCPLSGFVQNITNMNLNHEILWPLQYWPECASTPCLFDFTAVDQPLTEGFHLTKIALATEQEGASWHLDQARKKMHTTTLTTPFQPDTWPNWRKWYGYHWKSISHSLTLNCIPSQISETHGSSRETSDFTWFHRGVCLRSSPGSPDRDRAATTAPPTWSASPLRPTTRRPRGSPPWASGRTSPVAPLRRPGAWPAKCTRRSARWIGRTGMGEIYGEMIWNDMKWYDMIWNDMKWYEMIWNAMKWYEMIWNDGVMGLKMIDFNPTFMVRLVRWLGEMGNIFARRQPPGMGGRDDFFRSKSEGWQSGMSRNPDEEFLYRDVLEGLQQDYSDSWLTIFRWTNIESPTL